MRLLLDEHFSRRVAVELRRGRHDVIAVTEAEDLRGLPDVDLLAHARTERRAVVTQNFADFSILLREAVVSETEHFGVVFVPRRVWSSIRDFDSLVEALVRFLEERPGEHALLGSATWLGA